MVFSSSWQSQFPTFRRQPKLIPLELIGPSGQWPTILPNSRREGRPTRRSYPAVSWANPMPKKRDRAFRLRRCPPLLWPSLRYLRSRFLRKHRRRSRSESWSPKPHRSLARIRPKDSRFRPRGPFLRGGRPGYSPRLSLFWDGLLPRLSPEAPNSASISAIRGRSSLLRAAVRSDSGATSCPEELASSRLPFSHS